MASRCREVGQVTTDMGEIISVGVDGGTVGIYIGGWLSADGITLNAAQREQFSRLYFEAERQAEASDA